MNFDRDFDAFSAMLNGLWAIKGQTLTAGARMEFFKTMEPWPLREVEAGIEAHKADPERGRFLPMPADIIAQIKGIVANDGRPGAEEAWAMALRSRDEAVTVVWTTEMAEAMGVCQPLLDLRDEIGARMAFKETYTRLVGVAREARKAPVWAASLGHNAQERDAVLLPHVQAGRLLHDVLSTKAPDLAQLLLLPPPPNASAKALAARETALLRIAALREKWRNEAPPPSSAELEHQRIEALKLETNKRVEAYAAKGVK